MNAKIALLNKFSLRKVCNLTVQKQITLCNIKLKSGQINFIGRWWIKTQFIFQKNFCKFLCNDREMSCVYKSAASGKYSPFSTYFRRKDQKCLSRICITVSQQQLPYPLTENHSFLHHHSHCTISGSCDISLSDVF